MKIHEHYDVISTHLISKWRKELEKNDDCRTMKAAQEEKEFLTAQLNDEQKTHLNYFELEMIGRFDYIYYEICKRLFYFGLKAGMDLNKALDEE